MAASAAAAAGTTNVIATPPPPASTTGAGDAAAVSARAAVSCLVPQPASFQNVAELGWIRCQQQVLGAKAFEQLLARQAIELVSDESQDNDAALNVRGSYSSWRAFPRSGLYPGVAPQPASTATTATTTTTSTAPRLATDSPMEVESDGQVSATAPATSTLEQEPVLIFDWHPETRARMMQLEVQADLSQRMRQAQQHGSSSTTTATTASTTPSTQPPPLLSVVDVVSRAANKYVCVVSVLTTLQNVAATIEIPESLRDHFRFEMRGKHYRFRTLVRGMPKAAQLIGDFIDQLIAMVSADYSEIGIECLRIHESLVLLSSSREVVQGVADAWVEIGSKFDFTLEREVASFGALPLRFAMSERSPLSHKIIALTLVQSYRIRVQDEYTWGGAHLRGVYAGQSPLSDLRLYLQRALQVQPPILPTHWWNDLDTDAVIATVSDPSSELVHAINPAALSSLQTLLLREFAERILGPVQLTSSTDSQ